VFESLGDFQASSQHRLARPGRTALRNREGTSFRRQGGPKVLLRKLATPSLTPHKVDVNPSLRLSRFKTTLAVALTWHMGRRERIAATAANAVRQPGSYRRRSLAAHEANSSHIFAFYSPQVLHHNKMSTKGPRSFPRISVTATATYSRDGVCDDE